MAATDPAPSVARPAVHVCGTEALVARVAKLGWETVHVDSAGAESARTRELPLVCDDADSWSDDRLAAAVNLAVAQQAIKQLAALRAGARSATHDAKNAVGLIWLHIASLERNVGQGEAGPSAEVKDVVGQIKDETRSIVSLLDQLAASARG